MRRNVMLSRSRLIPAAVVAAGVAVTQIASAAPPAAELQGGVSVSPASIALTARAGASTTATVTNTTAGTLKVTVTPRPWRQARNGMVTANRSKRLRGVSVSDRAFSLAPGASAAVRVRLGRVPSAGSLFGALDVVGKPVKKRRGVNVNYRLIGRLRFNPVSRRYRLAAGKAAVKRRRLTLLVRNRGNTVDPVTGSVTISGAGGGRSGSIAAQSILPNGAVRVPLTTVRGLRAGTYRASISLSQGGRTRLTTHKRFRVR
jgi:hypothetical protein